MKKLLFILAFVCAGLGWVDCAQAQSPKFTATETGVGPIRVGAAMAELPASYTGLYDAFTVETIETGIFSHEQVTFTLGGEVVIMAIPDGGKIRYIWTESPDIATPNGIAPGTSIQEALVAGGEVDIVNKGTMHMKVDGFRFDISNKCLSERGIAKANRIWNTGNDEAFVEADFKADTTLGKMIIVVIEIISIVKPVGDQSVAF